MSKKFNKSLNFNYLSSNVSFGSISASTFTGSNLSISGSISSVELYSNKITGGNIVGTTISAGTLLATLITGGNLSISGTVTAGNLLGSTINGTNSTITNAVHTALSTGTLNATTSVNSAVVNATTRVSSANLNSSAITTGTIYITSSDTWQTGLNITNNNNNTWQLNVGGSTNNAVGINNIGLFNGTYRMVVTSTGNIGIGTGTPESKLHVNGAITIEGETITSAQVDSSNLNQTYLHFKHNGSSNDWAYLRQIGSSNNYLMALDIHDDGDEPGFCIRSITSTASPDTVNERFRVQANGNVGIGTSSPATTLDVSGTFRATTSVSSAALFATNVTATNIVATTISAGTLETSLVDITTTTNVPVNIASTYSAGANGYATSIKSNNVNMAANEVVSHNIGQASNTRNEAYFGYCHVTSGSTSNYATIGLNGVDCILNINGSGNVGIGTTSPSSRFSVVGAGSGGLIRTYPSSYNTETGFGFYSGQSSGNYWVAGKGSWSVGAEKFAIGSSLSNAAVITLDTNGSLDVAGSITSQALFTTNVTATNVVATTISSGTILGTTLISSANVAASLVTTGTLRSSSIVLSGSSSQVVTYPLTNGLENAFAYYNNTLASGDATRWVVGVNVQTGVGNYGFWNSSLGRPALMMTSTGNIGIGTTSPNSALTIFSTAGSSNTESGNSGISINSSLTYATASLYMGADATNNIGWISASRNGSYSNLILNARGGSVGINTTSPSTTLDVTGTFRATTSITTGLLNATNVTGTNVVATTISSGTILGTNIVGTTISVGTVRITGPSGVGSNGSVLITGSDSYGHSLYVESATSNRRLVFNNTGTVGNIFAYDYGSLIPQNLTLQGPGGNVGIGTLSPTMTLDVSGTFRATTSVTSGALYATNVTATNIVATAISAGTLVGTTITGANLSLSGNLVVGGTLTTVNITTTNVVDTNISAGTLTATNINVTTISAGTLVGTLITGGNLSISGTVTAGRLLSTNITATNIVGTTAISAGTILATTRVSSANLNSSIISTGTLIASGNLGINTVSPQAELHVHASDLTSLLSTWAGAGAYSNIDFSYDNSSLFGTAASARIKVTDSNFSASIDFQNRNQGSDNSTMNSRLFIGATGNVGVGTSSPSYKLHVSGDIYATGDISAFSDIRLKSNVRSITDSLDRISRLRGVYYTHTETQKESVGLIAQETLSVLPEVVATKGEYLGINYGNIVGLLIEGIKEMQNKIDTLEAKINNL